MWRRSWVNNEHLLNFICWLFYFCMWVRYLQKYTAMDYLFSHIFLFLFLLFILSLFLPADILFVTLFVTVYALFLAVKCSYDISIFLAVRIVVVSFLLCTFWWMCPCWDKNIVVWRQERTHDWREHAHNSYNWDNSVATGYQSNNDSFGIAWLRDTENPRWFEGKIYR